VAQLDHMAHLNVEMDAAAKQHLRVSMLRRHYDIPFEARTLWKNDVKIPHTIT
jgi:hypothetical protein